MIKFLSRKLSKNKNHKKKNEKQYFYTKILNVKYFVIMLYYIIILRPNKLKF